MVETNPKISKARLAPIEIVNDKMRSIKIKELELKEKEPSLAGPTIHYNHHFDLDYVEKSWKNHIEPLLILMNDYFRSSRKLFFLILYTSGISRTLPNNFGFIR